MPCAHRVPGMNRCCNHLPFKKAAAFLPCCATVLKRVLPADKHMLYAFVRPVRVHVIVGFTKFFPVKHTNVRPHTFTDIADAFQPVPVCGHTGHATDCLRDCERRLLSRQPQMPRKG